ncbi:hypothetical protein TVAG_273810 [Trichomonas vaginalis G3]|uniref:Uncharacterized protein n=1 Tax=Trichomonas vaginalis (strain ATCC PRA-98 / G3) TaxID=412133 RepID=A2EI58_TRIV3|nr:ankyrin repeat and sterile alpha motif-containing protein [Trichomonas vaginalis G3]EAY07697.1 hypothetical protein TVAG_273810 [Trichomonas vaginalis G3]KAI5518473.1 ankyrin repeat and sterile alpha motif-containing protein [Trichomonas vaginalis G3]|eukprot:XP_001319920.1 hypothetical protein [Trichomonas vaginalis G3]
MQDNEGKTALHYAAINDNKNFVKWLVDRANFEISDNEGKTFLHYAAINGNKNFVKLLVDRANFEISDNEGKIPLHYAVISGNVKTALKVIENTYYIRKRDNNSKFPLQYAVNDSRMFESLVFDYKKREKYYKLKDALECFPDANTDIQRFISNWKNGLWVPGDD